MCQPAASDTPDIIQTECVTNSGLACPNKNTESKWMEIGVKTAKQIGHQTQISSKGRRAAVEKQSGNGRTNCLKIGGIYREHQILDQGETDASGLERQRAQEKRWNKVLNNWKAAGNQSTCIAIGDFNLDQKHWANPEQHLINMVALPKTLSKLQITVN